MKTILIQVTQNGEDAGEQEPEVLGLVSLSPPALLKHWSDEQLKKHLDDEWAAWHEHDPHPDCDSNFITWLTERGWTEKTTPIVHSIAG